jgi:hypothetical protein
MEEEGKCDDELYENEPTIWAGKLEGSVYIVENTCPSQPVTGTKRTA